MLNCQKLAQVKRLKVTTTLTKLMAIMLFLLTLWGCSHKVIGKYLSLQESAEFEKVFSDGIPHKLTGDFYRAELVQEAFEDDAFYKMIVTKDALRVQKYGQTSSQVIHEGFRHHQAYNNTWILQDGRDLKYYKAVLENDKDVSISDGMEDYQQAVDSKMLERYSHKKPDSSFGLTTKEIAGRYYISEDDFTRYYEFDWDEENPVLSNFSFWKINQDGTESILKNYNLITVKKGRYTFHTTGKDDYTTLAKIGPDELQDAETGEKFTVFCGEKSPKEQVWQMFNIKLKIPSNQKGLT